MAAAARTMRSSRARRQERARAQSRLYIDPKKIPNEFVYQWKREAVLGAPDPNNITENLITGWSPVPADHHPELVPPPFPGAKADTLIRRGGLILCRRPREDVEQDLEDLRIENEETIAALDSAENGNFHPSMPMLRPERHTAVEVGVPRNRTGAAEFEQE